MDSNKNESLYQKAGEIIVNKYKNFKDIPQKYIFFYANYIPLSIGIKRKFEESIV
jgi:hypothetical protein